MRTARLLIAFAALRQVLFPIPVITLFWRRQLGMTLADIMLLQAIFALAVTVWELPSGYLADRIGYQRSLLVASVLWVAGWAAYTLAGTFLAAVAAEIALGAGMAFASGADSALLWVSLESAGRVPDYGRWEGRLQAASQTSESVSAACGGYLYTIAPRLPFWLQLPVAVLALVVALAMRSEPGVRGDAADAAVGGARPAQEPDQGAVRGGTREGPARAALSPPPRHGTPHARRLLRVTRMALGQHARIRSTIALSVALGMSSFVLVWLIQPYMEERAIPEVWFGPVWAAANLWVGLMALASHRVAAALGLGPTLLGCCLLVAAGYGLLAATPAWYGVAWYLLIMTLRGVQIPLLRQRLQADAPPEDRATVMSLNAMAFRLAFVAGGPLVGALLARLTLTAVLAVLGAVFTALALAAWGGFRRAHL